MKTLQIDFVSDVACPWCAVALLALFDERPLQRQRFVVGHHAQAPHSQLAHRVSFGRPCRVPGPCGQA